MSAWWRLRRIRREPRLLPERDATAPRHGGPTPPRRPACSPLIATRRQDSVRWVRVRAGEIPKLLPRTARRPKARPDYAQSSACAPGSMETRAPALRKPVIPCHSRGNGRKAGIRFSHESLRIPAFAGMTDFLGVRSRLDRGNSGSFGLCDSRDHLPSFVRNQETRSSARAGLEVAVSPDALHARRRDARLEAVWSVPNRAATGIASIGNLPASPACPSSAPGSIRPRALCCLLVREGPHP